MSVEEPSKRIQVNRGKRVVVGVNKELSGVRLEEVGKVP